ncbi:MAG: hypothetical protein PHI24_13905 [Desulfitobacteriaceae bacterium]|nr:hypothetical protein [Desulfitobacteriaceae bacterium]
MSKQFTNYHIEDSMCILTDDEYVRFVDTEKRIVDLEAQLALYKKALWIAA